MRKPHLLRSFEIYGRHSGHVRTVPVPDWVKARVDDWMKASGTASGCLFRSINERGIVWGNGLTEKVVWYVVKNFAKTVGIEKVAPHDLRRYAPGSVTLQVESSNRSNFCSGMSRCRRQSVTLVASRKSRAPLMTALASSRND